MNIPLLDGTKKEYILKIYDIGMPKKQCNKVIIGNNKFAVNDMKDSVVFGIENQHDGIDATLIVAEFPKSKEKMLLCCRFHNKLTSALDFGENFYKYAKENFSVGKDFNEVSVICCFVFG